jgi:hypothetical protein
MPQINPLYILSFQLNFYFFKWYTSFNLACCTITKLKVSLPWCWCFIFEKRNKIIFIRKDILSRKLYILHLYDRFIRVSESLIKDPLHFKFYFPNRLYEQTVNFLHKVRLALAHLQCDRVDLINPLYDLVKCQFVTANFEFRKLFHRLFNSLFVQDELCQIACVLISLFFNCAQKLSYPVYKLLLTWNVKFHFFSWVADIQVLRHIDGHKLNSLLWQNKGSYLLHHVFRACLQVF